MPAKWLICPDGEKIEIAECLSYRGCRLKDRCAPMAYLRSIAYDREWRGITASMAGNGPRLIYLKRVTDYAIRPDDRAFAVLGVKSHAWLARESVTNNVLSEEVTEHGRPDCLEDDEYGPGYYILIDYKTFGSYKVAMVLGLQKNDHKEFVVNPDAVDMYDIELQLNRYRMDFEAQGLKISKMYVYAIIRDGNTYIAKSRGIVTNTRKIQIKRLPDKQVQDYYTLLESSVEMAMKTGYIYRCNEWESWDGKRCSGFCEVSEACQKMDAIKREE